MTRDDPGERSAIWWASVIAVGVIAAHVLMGIVQAIFGFVMLSGIASVANQQMEKHLGFSEPGIHSLPKVPVFSVPEPKAQEWLPVPSMPNLERALKPKVERAPKPKPEIKWAN